MSEEKTETAALPRPKTDATLRSLDRKHWAARIGIPFGALKNKDFKKQYPFEPHLHNIGGQSYHYLDEGEGEAVVMVHGNPTWSFFYRELVLGLRDQYRCLVPDHLGMGLSEKPQDYPYDLDHHIANLELWLEDILPPQGWKGGKINLIVHDWGGPIGLGYAIRHPERINRVVVMNTSAFTAGDMPTRIKMCRWGLFGEIIVRAFNLFAGLAAKQTTVKPLPPPIRKGFLLPYNSWKNRVGVFNFVKDIPLKAGGKTHKTLSKIDEGIAEALAGKPLLVQWGLEDWCFTEFFLNLWKERFPEAEVDTYKAGHYLLEDAGGQILARVQGFLQRPLS